MTQVAALPVPRQTRRTVRGVPFLTPQERATRGRSARAVVSRTAQGEYDAPSDRWDPVDLLERQSASRVPELVPIRYGRMLESPFRFYRGAAALMAADLARGPHSGLSAQLCGDAHMLNFRLLGSPERHMMFDINDFDETLPGPWEWDVKRLATSLVIAGRANGFNRSERRVIVTSAASSYREFMRRFAEMRHLDVWYAQADVERLQPVIFPHLAERGRQKAARAVAKARGRDTLQAFEKLTVITDGERRIAADPPLLVPVSDLVPEIEREELETQLVELLRRYGRSLTTDRRHLLEQFRFVDMARKVVGVGSVGTRCWIVLLLGRDDNDPLLLQVKEAQASVLADHLPNSVHANQGQRVVAGQRLMQAASDLFLGWERAEGIDGRTRDFYIRQLRDWKGIAVPETMNPQEMRVFGGLCGATLARAHARSGDRVGIAAYLGNADTFDRAMARFAESYADQNERDFAALTTAASEGRITPVAVPA